MSRARSLAIVVVVALAYTAANAVDAALADLPQLTRMVNAAQTFIDLPAFFLVVLLLFGGLPLAVFGLLLERQWAGVPMEQRRLVRVPYTLLMFQIVSMTLSGVWLALTGPSFLWALSSGYVYLEDWLWPGYLTAQLLTSVTVIPVWRRFVMNASGIRTGSLRITGA